MWNTDIGCSASLRRSSYQGETVCNTDTAQCAIPIEDTGVVGTEQLSGAPPLPRFPHLNCLRGAQKGEGNRDDDYRRFANPQ